MSIAALLTEIYGGEERLYLWSKYYIKIKNKHKVGVEQ